MALILFAKNKELWNLLFAKYVYSITFWRQLCKLKYQKSFLNVQGIIIERYKFLFVISMKNENEQLKILQTILQGRHHWSVLTKFKKVFTYAAVSFLCIFKIRRCIFVGKFHTYCILCSWSMNDIVILYQKNRMNVKPLYMSLQRQIEF